MHEIATQVELNREANWASRQFGVEVIAVTPAALPDALALDIGSYVIAQYRENSRRIREISCVRSLVRAEALLAQWPGDTIAAQLLEERELLHAQLRGLTGMHDNESATNRVRKWLCLMPKPEYVPKTPLIDDRNRSVSIKTVSGGLPTLGRGHR